MMVADWQSVAAPVVVFLALAALAIRAWKRARRRGGVCEGALECGCSGASAGAVGRLRYHRTDSPAAPVAERPKHSEDHATQPSQP
jgi:hypothetical protein